MKKDILPEDFRISMLLQSLSRQIELATTYFEGSSVGGNAWKMK
jgi:hypothetical protein